MTRRKQRFLVCYSGSGEFMTNNTVDEWGVPDWKNKDAYPTGDDALSLNAWRWEFLRRDQKYRNAWLDRTKHPRKYFDFDLREWLDPREMGTPNFFRPCYELEFDRKDAWEQKLHYMALADSKNVGGLNFSIDIYSPIEGQLDIIRNAYNRQVAHMHPDDRVQKAVRKNNSTSKSKARSRGLMLRLLDADNAEITIPAFLDHVADEGISISETSMRRTLSFAQDFWKRL